MARSGPSRKSQKKLQTTATRPDAIYTASPATDRAARRRPVRLFSSWNFDVHQRNKLLAAMHVSIAKIALYIGSRDAEFERTRVVALEECDVPLLASEQSG